jgi:hypothetical protein
MVSRHVQHVTRLEPGGVRERVQSLDRHANGPAPGQVEGGALDCGDGHALQAGDFVVKQCLAAGDHTGGRLAVGEVQVDRRALVHPFGTVQRRCGRAGDDTPAP